MTDKFTPVNISTLKLQERSHSLSLKLRKRTKGKKRQKFEMVLPWDYVV